MTGSDSASELRYAVLRDYPVRLWHRQREYYDQLLREFNLLLIGQHAGAGSPPGRLVELAEMLTSRFASELDEMNARRQAAFDAGLPTIDSRVPLVEGVREIMGTIEAVMAEVDEFCRAGDMLTLAMPPDIAALRDWTASEILRQLDGAEPTPWTGPVG